ncbi:cation:proton antiporter [Geoglobus acetivorans]|uniref:Sodium/hydrogen exchanger family protein n=1 Tax=Geoglobus acetivorans TaxID=565033 RepID=A0A0A7GFK6_GEOAI|nr:sodium/hydrogen exchanger family protein [Geoglobus acetivorans]
MEIAIAGLVCLIFAIIARKLSFPAIPVYIIAGLALGSSGFGILQADEVSKKIAEFGVVFLLFYIGLHINPREIGAKRKTIFASGFYDLLINFALVFILLSVTGFELSRAFIIASSLYISSSAIVLQSLIENRKLILKEAEIIVWMMVFEDIVIAILIVLNSIGFSDLMYFFAKLTVFTVTVLILSNTAPKYLDRAMERDDEVPLLLVFSAGLLGLAIEELFQIPYAYAAILIGLMFSQVKSVEEMVIPFKDVFLILFFFFFGVSTKFDMGGLALGIVLALVAISGKVASGLLTGLRTEKSWKSGLEIGLNTIARGEFSIFMAFAFGDVLTASAITVTVLITSILGSLTSRYSEKIISILGRASQ